MNIASTIIAVILIAAILAGAVYFIWATRNKGKPSYMIEPKKPKPSKEEKAAAKQEKKAQKAEKKAGKKA